MDRTRRHILKSGAALGACALSPTPSLASATNGRWIGCRKVGDQHYATQFDGEGQVLTNTQLPDRGHGIIIAPDGTSAVIMARRPGTYALQIDLETGESCAPVESAQDRHFYGHGCFSRDGALFFTTENDIRSGNGVLSVRDARDGMRELASFPSGGIGPHETRLLEDGITLAIANGGIMTRPETGRTPLNLTSMAPSLVMMDSRTGDLKSQHHLPENRAQLSIRHMSAHGNQIALALQYEGPKSDATPLLALFEGENLRLAETPAPLARAMRNYAGSITHDLTGMLVAMTCPKANLVTFWNAETGEPVGHKRANDVCGVAPGQKPGEFILTAQADILVATLTGLQPRESLANSQWDNHLTRIA
ncbi:MAG: DUF1513 domain-containing protein [Parvibaculum sp.]